MGINLTKSVLLSSLTLFLSLFFNSCSNDSGAVDIKKYYFPFETFATPVEYIYANSLGYNDYWLMRYDETSKTFTTEIKLVNQNEISVESIDSIGSSFIEYFTVRDGNEYYSEIYEDQVVNWKMTVGDKLVWKIENVDANKVQYIQKTRELINVNLSVIYNGKTLDAIEFDDHYKITTIYLNRNKKVEEFNQRTTYAEKIGLYSFQRTFDDGSMYMTELMKINK